MMTSRPICPANENPEWESEMPEEEDVEAEYSQVLDESAIDGDDTSAESETLKKKFKDFLNSDDYGGSHG